jgi:hypothetical protein
MPTPAVARVVLATGSRSNHPARWRLVDFLLHCEEIMNILHSGDAGGL